MRARAKIRYRIVGARVGKVVRVRESRVRKGKGGGVVCGLCDWGWGVKGMGRRMRMEVMRWPFLEISVMEDGRSDGRQRWLIKKEYAN